MTATDARPISIGEILNRAVATYGRRFVPLFLILAVFALPAGVLGAATSPDFAHVVQLLNQLVSLKASDALGHARLMNELNRSAPGLLPAFYTDCFELIFYPLAHTALIAYAVPVLDGATPAIASAYRVAVRRWLPQIVVMCAFLALALAVLAGFAVASVVVGLPIFLIGGFSGAYSRSLELVAEVGAGIVAFAGLVVAFALEFVAWQMASISVAVGDGTAVHAIVRGLRRTLDRPLLRRTLAIALVVIALEWFGSLAILALVDFIDFLTHLTVLDRILAGSGGVVLDGVCTMFVLVYMRDVQLRREGSDLMRAATLIAPDAHDERDDGLDASDRTLIAQFLARRGALEPRAAGEIAARIAERVRPKLRASFHYLNDVDLLEHLGR